MKSEYGLLVREEENPGNPIPLLGVKAEGEIMGRGARVRVLQRFRNQESKAVEAIYKFPLPEGAAICGFKAHIGDRVIEGNHSAGPLKVEWSGWGPSRAATVALPVLFPQIDPLCWGTLGEKLLYGMRQMGCGVFKTY
jgi:hypothetical protein